MSRKMFFVTLNKGSERDPVVYQSWHRDRAYKRAHALAYLHGTEPQSVDDGSFVIDAAEWYDG